MKKLSDTYKELGIAFSFPIEIRNKNGKVTYYENSDGYWLKKEHDDNGNETYYENSNWYWCKRKYDENGKETYCANSYGFWCKKEYDKNGKETYYENSKGEQEGTPRSYTCEGKVITVDGKKYKLTEV